jgi:hypothetical protein
MQNACSLTQLLPQGYLKVLKERTDQSKPRSHDLGQMMLE